MEKHSQKNNLLLYWLHYKKKKIELIFLDFVWKKMNFQSQTCLINLITFYDEIIGFVDQGRAVDIV